MKSRVLKSFVGLFLLVVVPTSNAASVSGQGSWETTLLGRDLDGNVATFEAYYDTLLDITWLADANYAMTSGFDVDGRMTWSATNSWVANLNINGITGWRLPTAAPVDGSTADESTYSWIGTEDRGYNVSASGTLFEGSTASEMAHLYYNTLGNLGYCDPSTSTETICSEQFGWGLSNTGPFTKLQSNWYWSDTRWTSTTAGAWSFYFNRGLQDNYGIQDEYSNYAFVVHPGDVSAVPVPAAVWLFGSGLLGLMGAARRRSILASVSYQN